MRDVILKRDFSVFLLEVCIIFLIIKITFYLKTKNVNQQPKMGSLAWVHFRRAGLC